MAPTNHAAWIVEATKSPLEVKTAPVPEPGQDELVIAAHAVAINPVDWKVQRTGRFPLPYPNVLGCDLAGIVHAVGSSSSSTFQKGDRVLAHSTQLGSKDPTCGAFQNYVKVQSVVTAKIPDHISFTDATVLPLAIDTASAGLFQTDYLGLPHPTLSPKPTNKIILVWGGSSSVGTAAIQLARSAGVSVITTASKQNQDLCSSLGAERVFDHTNEDVVDQISDYFKSSGKEITGAYDAISIPETAHKCADILVRTQSPKKFVALTLGAPDDLPNGVEGKSVSALTVSGNELGAVIWRDFLPEALAKGVLKPAPRAEVVGKGLEFVQKGMEMSEKGLSGAKAVIEL